MQPQKILQLSNFHSTLTVTLALHSNYWAPTVNQLTEIKLTIQLGLRELLLFSFNK